MFYCYLTDEWKGVEGKLNGFGSCKVELLGHTSRIPAVIRWSMLDISGHDTNVDVCTDTLTQTSHLSQHCHFLPAVMRVWYQAVVGSCDISWRSTYWNIMNVLTLNIIQLSCLHKCIKNMYFFMQRCVEYYVLINNTNSIIQLYKKYILVIHNKLHLLFNKNNYCLSVGLFIDISSHYASISNSSMRYLEIAQQYQYNWSLSPQLYL